MKQEVPTIDSAGRGAFLRPGLLAALGLGLLLRLPRLFESIWFDELWSTRLRVGGLFQLLRTIYRDVHPPLYDSVMAAWVALFGDSEIVIRLLPLLCGVGSVFLLIRLGRRTCGDRCTRLAAAILAFSPVHAWYSTEARPYSAYVLVSLATILCFDRAQQEDAGRRHRLAFTASLFGMSLLHYYGVAYAGTFALLVILRRGPYWRSMLLGIALSAGPTLVWLALRHRLGIFTGSSGHLRSFSPPALLTLLGDWLPSGRAIGEIDRHELGRWTTWAAIIAALAYLALFARGMRRLRDEEGRDPRYRGGPLLLHLFSIPMLLAILPWLGFERTYIERSALPMLPLWALILARGLVSIRDPRRRRVVIAAVLALQFSCAVWSLYVTDRITIGIHRPDWRAMARELEVEMQGDWKRRLLLALPSRGHELGYYDDRIQPLEDFEGDERELDRLEEKLQGLPGTAATRHWLAGLARSQAEVAGEWKRRNAARVRLVRETLDPDSAAREARRISGEDEPVVYVVGPKAAETEAGPIRELLARPDVVIESTTRVRLQILWRIRFRR